MIRRTSSGKAKNGTTAGQCRRQDIVIAGYLSPHSPVAKAARAVAPASASLLPVDLLQRRGDRLAVLVGHEVERVADQVHDPNAIDALRVTVCLPFAGAGPARRRQRRDARFPRA